MGRGQHMAGLLSQQLWIAHVYMAISLAAYSPAAHFKARPSLVNLFVNGHVKGAWLWFR